MYDFVSVILVCLFFSSFVLIGSGQTEERAVSVDSIAEIPTQFYAFMPELFSVDYEGVSGQNRVFRTRNERKVDLPLHWGHQIGVFGIIPLISRKKGYSLSLTGNYNWFGQDFDELSVDGQAVGDINSKPLSDVTTSINVSKFLKIMGKSLILSGRVAARGHEVFDPEEFTGMFSASIPLKNTARTSLTVGLTFIAGKNITIPVVPTFTYAHKLNPKWNLELLLPSHARVRYIA